MAELLLLKVYPFFVARLYECTGRAIALPLAFAAAAWTKCQSFTLKVFKVMGKALSGEQSYTRTGLVDFGTLHTDIGCDTLIKITLAGYCKEVYE